MTGQQEECPRFNSSKQEASQGTLNHLHMVVGWMMNHLSKPGNGWDQIPISSICKKIMLLWTKPSMCMGQTHFCSYIWVHTLSFWQSTFSSQWVHLQSSSLLWTAVYQQSAIMCAKLAIGQWAWCAITSKRVWIPWVVRTLCSLGSRGGCGRWNNRLIWTGSHWIYIGFLLLAVCILGIANVFSYAKQKKSKKIPNSQEAHMIHIISWLCCRTFSFNWQTFLRQQFRFT